MSNNNNYSNLESLLSFISNNLKPVAMFDQEIKYVAHSKKWLEIFNIKNPDIIGKHHYEILPNISEDLKNIYTRCLKGASISKKDDKYIIEGGVMYLNWDISPWYQNRGEIGGIIMFANDFTDHTENKFETERQLRSMREAQELAKIGHWELDLTDNSLFWSDEVYRIFGLKPQEFDATYEAFLERIHPDDRASVNDAYNNSVLNKTSYQITHRILTVDNELKYVEERCLHDFDHEGNVKRSIGTVHDITKKKEKENLLDILTNISKAFLDEDEEKLFTDLLTILLEAFECEDGIVGYIDKEENFISPSLNNTIFEMHRMKGRPVALPKDTWNSLLSNTPIDKTISSFLKQKDAELKNSINVPILKNDQIIGVFVVGNKKNGFSKQDKINSFEVSQHISPILGSWLDNLFYKKELEEINIGLEERVERETEVRKRNEQILFEQKKFIDMGQMINAIAHQWRQPLNNIELLSNMIKDIHQGGDYDIDIDVLFEKHTNLVNHMSTTIDDFRYFFSMKKDKVDFSIVKELLMTIELIKPQYDNNSISIKVLCVCEDHEMSCDQKYLSNYCDKNNDIVNGYPNGLKQVFLNILSNARDAILESYKEGVIKEKVIEIKTHIYDNFISIDFFNRGKTIPEDIICRVFEPYFTTKKAGKGTGIGLYMSKEIVEKNLNGTLTCSNTKDGVNFNINIPL